jgi:hypothetical protein
MILATTMYKLYIYWLARIDFRKKEKSNAILRKEDFATLSKILSIQMKKRRQTTYFLTGVCAMWLRCPNPDGMR